jgi:inner membrane protein
MESRLPVKILLLAFLLIAFSVGFAFIGWIRSDRENYRAKVVREVSASTAGPQILAGPLLVVPYRARAESHTVDNAGRTTTVTEIVERRVILTPESLSVQGTVAVESRRRGIHEARVLDARLELAAEFAPPGPDKLPADVVEWEPAFIAMGLSDTRGLRQSPAFTWQGTAVPSAPGTRIQTLNGCSAAVGRWSPVDGPAAHVRVTMPVVGTERLGFVPVGKQTDVRLGSRWPHPSFSGRFLPDRRTVGADGFRAEWRLSQFATGIEEPVRLLGEGVRTANGSGALDAYEFGVSFIEPVDVYRLSDRAVKYGMLFVLLTFVGFILFEVLRRLSIHPVQYALVGGAVSIFFLLLLSLSEHIPFGVAYVIAAVACLGLIVHYVSHVLGSVGRALGFGAGLAALYGMLYVVLASEDYALLLGTLVLFAVLAFVMIATRRIDWSRAGAPGPNRVPQA